MAKKDNQKNGRNGKNGNGKDKPRDSILSFWAKRWIRAILLFLAAIIVVLSFPSFNKAGYAGQMFARVCGFLIGKAFYIIPLFLFIAGLIFLKTRKKGKNLAMALAVLISLVGVSGILAIKDLSQRNGGWIGFLLAKLFAGLFGILVADIIFGAILLIGLFIFLQFIWQEFPRKEKEEKPTFAVNRQEQENLKIKGIEQPEKQEKLKPETSRITLFKRKRRAGKSRN